MYSTQYYQPIDYLTSRQTGLSYIRILHASPDIPAVDVYINNSLIGNGIAYKAFTPYIGLHPGSYDINIYPTGEKVSTVISTYITVEQSSIYTAAVTGMIVDSNLQIIQEPVIAPLMNKTRVRFMHLSPDAPAVDIILPNSTKIFTAISYKEITGYKPLIPGRYKFQIYASDTNKIILNVPNIILRPGRNLSIYAVGYIHRKPPLQVLIPLDGSSYLTL